MKCPKCEYLGFETSDRCRNCGYEFALSDLSPLDQPAAGAVDLRPALDLDRIIGAPAEELPLFGGGPGLTDGEPLITTPSRPRAPLGVRRATPEIPRARVRPSRTVEETLFDSTPAPPVERRQTPAYSTPAPQPPSAVDSAAPASRAIAALLDGAILLGIDAAVVYFTLRLCDLTGMQLFELPLAPLVAFLFLLDGGYFFAFTAVGGQSIGKMALGIKVVSDDNRTVPLGAAAVRTAAFFVSALPLGAGFLPGVLGADRLALHDRLAHTRVVRPA